MQFIPDPNMLDWIGYILAFMLAGFGSMRRVGDKSSHRIIRHYTNKISFAPPNWVYPIVWSALYFFLALGFWDVLRNESYPHYNTWIILALVQFALLAAWPTIFWEWVSWTLALFIVVGIAIISGVLIFMSHTYPLVWITQAVLIAWLIFAGALNFAHIQYQSRAYAAIACSRRKCAEKDSECVREAEKNNASVC